MNRYVFASIVVLTGSLASDAIAQGHGHCAAGGGTTGGGTTTTGVVTTGLTGTGTTGVSTAAQLAMQQAYLQQMYVLQQAYAQQEAAMAEALAAKKERKLAVLRQRRATEVARWSSSKSKGFEYGSLASPSENTRTGTIAASKSQQSPSTSTSFR